MPATMNKKRTTKAANPSKQQVTEDNLHQYQDVFSQITRYTDTIKSGADFFSFRELWQRIQRSVNAYVTRSLG